MSDHCILKFACHQYFTQYKNHDKLRLDRVDYKQLREFLNLNWDDFLKAHDNSVDDMWEIFKVVMHDGIKQSIPTSRFYGKKGNAKKNFQFFFYTSKVFNTPEAPTMELLDFIRKEVVYKEYKVIRNKVKSEMAKLLRQEQETISMHCKKTLNYFF